MMGRPAPGLARAPLARAAFARAIWVAGCVLLAGCATDSAPQAFTPPDYGYLPKLRLNVASLSVVDHAPAGEPDDLAQNAPTPPRQALEQMARERLVAAGNSGSAVFTIDQASILGAGGGGLDGRLAVHLDILTASGGHAGYAEAHVSRQFTPGSDTANDGARAELYSLTRQMMRDMNVEFEYQVRRTLSDWLVDASGAPVAGSVDQQTLAPPTDNPAGGGSVGNTPLGATPLTPTPRTPTLGTPTPGTPTPGTPTPGTPTPGAPTPPAPSSFPAAPPSASSAPTPLRSPPPGFLQPPPGSPPLGSPRPGSVPPTQ